MLKENIIFSIEKGFRFLETGISLFHFFMIQFEINKNLIKNNFYRFSLVDKNRQEIYSKEIFLDITKKRIITPNSHEDPLIEDKNNYYICFQIENELLPNFTEELDVFFYEKDKNLLKLISFANVGVLFKIYDRYNGEHYSKIINEYQIVSKKDCSLTLHLSDSNAEYLEQYFQLKANEIFSFKDYIQKFEYIGVQCSYENENPEIEEKHIIVGQKGIYLSGYFYDNGVKIMPPLLFLQKYQKEYKLSDFVKINFIDELINFYQSRKIKPKYFESDLNFLLPGYLEGPTYNQDKLYSDKKPTKTHQFLLECCKICPHNFKCIQVVPSGLSSELFKKNIAIEKPNDCKIFNLLDES